MKETKPTITLTGTVPTLLKVAQPPKQGSPKPPKGPQKKVVTTTTKTGAKKASHKGYLAPTEQQVRDADDVALEVLKPTYLADMGPRAPEPGLLAEALRTGKAWANELAAAEAWLPYVKAQYQTAWTNISTLIDVLGPEFQLAAKHDPDVLTTYRQTTAFLDVRRAAGAKGAATRKEKKRKAAKAAGK